MAKTITFSFTSTEFKGTEATETFTFEDLNLDENMDEMKLENEINRVYHAWVWGNLDSSSSIVIEGQDAAY